MTTTITAMIAFFLCHNSNFVHVYIHNNYDIVLSVYTFYAQALAIEQTDCEVRRNTHMGLLIPHLENGPQPKTVIQHSKA